MKPCRPIVLIIAGALLALGTPSTQAAITVSIHGFGPSSYSSDTAGMDAALGITGYNFENFDDVSLTLGLSTEFENADFGPTTTAPTSSISPPVPGLDWAGANSSAIRNHIGAFGAAANVDILTFHVSGGATSFGVGLSEFESGGHTLLINGGTDYTVSNIPGFDFTIGSVPGFVVNGAGRGVYLRIDVESPSDLITSFGVDRTTRTVQPGDESFYADHVAFIPEPSCLTLLMLGFAIPLFHRVRHQRPK